MKRICSIYYAKKKTKFLDYSRVKLFYSFQEQKQKEKQKF